MSCTVVSYTIISYNYILYIYIYLVFLIEALLIVVYSQHAPLLPGHRWLPVFLFLEITLYGQYTLEKLLKLTDYIYIYN